MRVTSVGYRIGEMIAALLAGSLLFAACGQGNSDPTSSAGTATAQAETLCQGTSHVDRLVVRRTDANPQLHLYFPFPPVVTVTELASVRSAAKALCALPRMPKGVFHCPADIGIDYHLTFSADSRPYPTVLVLATGCQEVSGIGPTRWIARTPGFWRELGKAMGLAGASWSTFAGTAPSAPSQCTAPDVRIAASTNQRNYGPGQTVLMRSSITNVSKKPCIVWVGFWPSAVVTNNKGVEVWGRCWSHDEPGACSMVLVAYRLDPGRIYAYTARWDQRSAAPGKPPIRAPLGTYLFATQYQGIAAKAVRFEIRSR